jgi:hypothetical protein
MQTYWRDAAKVKADGQGVTNGGGILHLVILVAIREMRDPNERNKRVYMTLYIVIKINVFFVAMHAPLDVVGA